ncbi:MAG: response regulator [Ferruginibacter sp.]|nr:response regulator [Ferruginibacter sp.]
MILSSQISLNVYLADDDADDRFLFEEALMEVTSNVKLTTANNGEQLMNYLGKNTPPPPHFIFLDLNMPLKNGMECLDEIKRDTKLKDIPVVIFSTSCQKEAIDQVYIKGANYYMCKPDNFQTLKSLLDRVLSLSANALSNRPSREDFLISA